MIFLSFGTFFIMYYICSLVLISTDYFALTSDTYSLFSGSYTSILFGLSIKNAHNRLHITITDIILDFSHFFKILSLFFVLRFLLYIIFISFDYFFCILLVSLLCFFSTPLLVVFFRSIQVFIDCVNILHIFFF